MNFIRKVAITLGAVFFAALLITALAPRAARGITATIVEVTNTSANPVPTVSADANFPYEAFLCSGFDCDGTTPASFSVPSATTTGVPVKRLVIEDLNANCSGGGTLVELVLPPSADNNGFPLLAYQFLLNPSSGESLGRATVRIYVDPSATVSFAGLSPQCSMTLTGHLETK
jgi:hypothetical protein